MILFIWSCVIVITTLWRGLVLLQMWKWFAMPMGLPALTFAHCMGVGLLISYMTYQSDARNDRPTPKTLNANIERAGEIVLINVGIGIVTLGVANILHLFM